MLATASGLLRPLSEADLPAAQALLDEALPHDRAALVAQEKLLGGNGVRAGRSVGAFEDGELLGLLAQAGRWVKLLCVKQDARRRGLGTRLLWDARAHAGGALRVFDHPGNYLSPGLDARYEEGRAFLAARGFREVARIENLRVPLQGNELVTQARAAELREQAARRGYAVRRVQKDGPEAEALLSMVARAFSPVWAFEVARALGRGVRDLPEGPGVFAAFLSGKEPVAFAAHDGNNRGLGWFGPMGTLPEHRGQGLGEALLLPCLLDCADRPDGGVIAWVGPVAFYHRAAGAVSDRQFVVYEEG